jgi:hypothetical protein
MAVWSELRSPAIWGMLTRISEKVVAIAASPKAKKHKVITSVVAEAGCKNLSERIVVFMGLIIVILRKAERFRPSW